MAVVRFTGGAALAGGSHGAAGRHALPIWSGRDERPLVRFVRRMAVACFTVGAALAGGSHGAAGRPALPIWSGRDERPARPICPPDGGQGLFISCKPLGRPCGRESRRGGPPRPTVLNGRAERPARPICAPDGGGRNGITARRAATPYRFVRRMVECWREAIDGGQVQDGGAIRRC